MFELNDAEREREYSPSSAIGGNYQPWIQAYVQQSLAARERTQALGARWVELRYGSAPSQRMDLCLPRSAMAAGPCAVPEASAVAGDGHGGVGLLVYIHGGYWQELSARDSLFAAAHAVAHGLAFCALDYTLAPAAKLGDIVAECRRAVQTLVAQARKWGVDPSRIVLAGSSAGAHLAAMVCLPAPEGPVLAEPVLAAAVAHGGAAVPASTTAWRPRAVVLLSGIYVLTPLIGTSINQALGLDDSEAQALSPALLDLRGFPEALLAWGEIETRAFKQQSQHFAALLHAQGMHCESLQVAERNHFDIALDLADPGTLLGRRTLALFDHT